MKEVKLSINFLQEYYKQNFSGQIIDDPDHFHGLCSCQISIPKEKSIKFVCQATIKATGNNESNKINLMKTLSVVLTEKIKDLSNLNTFAIFDLYEVDVIDEEIPDSQYFSKVIQVHDSLIENLIPQIQYIDKIRKSFDFAVEQLSDYANYYPSELKIHYYNISALIRYIQDIVDSSYTYLHNWYNEKQSSIQYMFSDLMRRKNTNHENYKSQKEYIKRTLYGYHCPDLWIKKPYLNDDLISG